MESSCGVLFSSISFLFYLTKSSSSSSFYRGFCGCEKQLSPRGVWDCFRLASSIGDRSQVLATCKFIIQIRLDVIGPTIVCNLLKLLPVGEVIYIMWFNAHLSIDSISLWKCCIHYKHSSDNFMCVKTSVRIQLKNYDFLEIFPIGSRNRQGRMKKMNATNN